MVIRALLICEGGDSLMDCFVSKIVSNSQILYLNPIEDKRYNRCLLFTVPHEILATYELCDLSKSFNFPQIQPPHLSLGNISLLHRVILQSEWNHVYKMFFMNSNTLKYQQKQYQSECTLLCQMKCTAEQKKRVSVCVSRGSGKRPIEILGKTTKLRDGKRG